MLQKWFIVFAVMKKSTSEIVRVAIRCNSKYEAQGPVNMRVLTLFINNNIRYVRTCQYPNLDKTCVYNTPEEAYDSLDLR